MKHEQTIYVSEIKSVSFCGNKLLSFEYGQYLPPFSVSPSEGEHKLDECENCKSLYDSIYKQQEGKFKSFPVCCEKHRKLIYIQNYSRNDFKDSPEQIAKKIIYSYHTFINYVEKENWKKEIFDYIEYCFYSFGMFPQGYGEPYQLGRYFNVLKELISGLEFKENDKITHKEFLFRRKTVIEKIDSYFKPLKEEDENDSIKLLKIYDEWYQTFPFDLDYFKHLKEKYSKVLPIGTGNKRHNKYLNKTFHEKHTKDSLVNVLMDITINILSSINASELYEKGQLNDVDKIQLGLVLKNRKLEIEDLKLKPLSTKAQFLKVLSKWMKGEIDFIRDIKPFIKSPSKEDKKETSIKEPSIVHYALQTIYLQESKEIKYFENHPKGKVQAIIEYIEENKISTTRNYFQKTYNKYFNHPTNRIALNQIANIDYVINNMLLDSPKAKEIAINELKQAKTKNR